MGLGSHIFNSHSKADGNFFMAMRHILGFKPKDLSIYKKAFIHRSLHLKDAAGHPLNYERLEFLGDAMLGAIISKYIFQEVPAADEGYLTKMRSKIVSREHLNELGKELNLLSFVDSKVHKDHFGDNIHGNVFEALVGAIYLDKGYSYCERFIYKKIIEPHVDIEKLEGKVISYKSLLIEWCQKEKKTFNFQVYEDSGNDPVTHFSVKLSVNKQPVSKGRATSKKKAEEQAAKRGYYVLQQKMT